MLEFFESWSKIFDSFGTAFSDLNGLLTYIFDIPSNAAYSFISMNVLFPAYIWAPLVGVVILILLFKILGFLNYLPFW